MKKEITEAEPKCAKCGKNKFELSRMADYQILAVCTNCGESHTIDAVNKNASTPACLTFWSPKMEE